MFRQCSPGRATAALPLRLRLAFAVRCRAPPVPPALNEVFDTAGAGAGRRTGQEAAARPAERAGPTKRAGERASLRVMSVLLRVRIVGQVRPDEDLSVDLVREIEGLDVGDSFRIGEDRVQIVSLSRSFESAPESSNGFDAEWTVAPLPI
jgi:hypothetical protein